MFIRFLIFIVLTVGVSYAQIIPHTATISASKDSVYSTEIFTVTYTLTHIEGYFYIGLRGNFETIGTDRWEGFVKDNEITRVSFKVKLKEKALPLSKKQRIYVGFSYGPFGEKVIGAHYKIIPITIIDNERLKKLKNDTKMGNSTVQSNNSATVTITIGSGQVTTSAIPMETKTFEIDTTKSLDYFPSIDEPQKSLKINPDSIKSSKDTTVFNSSYDHGNSSTLAISITFTANAYTFRNATGAQLPWQHFLVRLQGLNSQNDTSPTLI